MLVQQEIQSIKQLKYCADKQTQNIIYTLILLILSTIIAYGHKIPIIKSIIRFLRPFFGKSGIWLLLRKFRQIFLVVQAIIGIYSVFLIIGFNGFALDNLFATLYAFITTDFDIFLSTIRKIFEWFISKFEEHPADHVTPDLNKGSIVQCASEGTEATSAQRIVHKPEPVYPKKWGEPPIEHINIIHKVTEINNMDLSSIIKYALWYGGIVILTGGTLYVGYIVITDPTIIEYIMNLFKGRGGGSGGQPPVAGAIVGGNCLFYAWDYVKNYYLSNSNVDTTALNEIINNIEVTKTTKEENVLIPMTEIKSDLDRYFPESNDVTKAPEAISRTSSGSSTVKGK